MKATRAFWTLPFAALVLAGCTEFPALDATITPALKRSEYPQLVPVGPLLAQAENGRIDPAQTQAALQGRLARLRARAARMRGSVLSGRERQRLRNGLQ